MQADTDKEAAAVASERSDDVEADVPESVETKDGITDFEEDIEKDKARQSK